jgi:hypothetical protein
MTTSRTQDHKISDAETICHPEPTLQRQCSTFICTCAGLSRGSQQSPDLQVPQLARQWPSFLLVPTMYLWFFMHSPREAQNGHSMSISRHNADVSSNSSSSSIGGYECSSAGTRRSSRLMLFKRIRDNCLVCLVSSSIINQFTR